LADKSTALLVAALSRAVAEPDGIPLHGRGERPGLFGTTSAARLTAQRAVEDGYLQPAAGASGVKAAGEPYTISEKGLTFLLSQASPRQVLEDFLRALEARQAQLDAVVASVQHMRAGLDAFRAGAQTVLAQLRPPLLNGHPAPSTNGHEPEAWESAALAHLARRREAGASDDWPLPELYRQACNAAPGLSIGRFHDGLRRLHHRQQIYLHPWTGPLPALPEPPLALLVGHEIAYYASLRPSEEGPLDTGT
jgi:hypothetical protein